MRTLVDERSRLYHEPWHRAVRDAAARLDLEPLLATHPPSGFVPDFVTPPPLHASPTLGEQLDQLRATPARAGERRARALPVDESRRTATRRCSSRFVADPAAARELLAVRMEEAWDALVAPFWPRIEELIEADIAYRSHRLVAHGLRGVLDGLHPAHPLDRTAPSRSTTRGRARRSRSRVEGSC